MQNPHSLLGLVLRYIDYKKCVLTLAPPKVIGTNRIGRFTLMGVSAGAFGVAFNYDDVAAVVKAKDPNAGAAIVDVPNKILRSQ